MAQGDLHRLLKRVSKALANDMNSTRGGGSERFRAQVDKYPHDVYINRNQVRDELLIQLQDFMLSEQLGVTQGVRQTFGSGSGRTREESMMAVQSLARVDGLTKDQIKIVEEQADAFVKFALRTVNEKPPRGIKIVKVSGDTNNFVLRFTSTNKSASVYDAVNKTIFQPAKARIAKQLSSKGFNISKTQESRIFNIGHVTAVSTLKGARALRAVHSGLNRMEGRYYNDPTAKAAADAIRLEIMAKFSQIGDPEFAKEFLLRAASVKVESEASNLTDSDYEAALLRDVRKSLEKMVTDMPNDWAGQKSSDSVLDAIAKDLVGAATKRKSKNVTVKTTGVSKKDLSSNSASETVKLAKPKGPKPKALSLNDFGKFDIPDSIRTAQSPINLTVLLPYINQRLPEVIRSHMGQSGRLHNRSGRFSESAQVVTVDNASFTIGYTYQVHPYGVFESQGSRDPRPLIEMSIREIARDAMVTRFNLRRL